MTHCDKQSCPHPAIWHVTVATITGIVYKNMCTNHLAEYIAMFGDDVYNVEIDRQD